MAIINREAKDTLTAVEMMHDDTLRYRLLDGAAVEIELVDSGAMIMSTTLKQPGVEESRAMTRYRFWGEFRIDGCAIRLEREVGTQKSFYEPWVIGKVRIWLDAVDAIFDFMNETHGPCRLQQNYSSKKDIPPRRHARLAIQDATARICPDKVLPWCPLRPEGLKIEDCYRGEDCWLGAYNGASAHGGLDINHPKGTPLYAPISFDNQFLYHRIEMGNNNNRWLGMRRWENGSQWILKSSHMTRLTVPEHRPLERGRQYAEGAGVRVGAVEHSHFAFDVFDGGELIHLDPWILFWQMYQDEAASVPRRRTRPTEASGCSAQETGGNS